MPFQFDASQNVDGHNNHTQIDVIVSVYRFANGLENKKK